MNFLLGMLAGIVATLFFFYSVRERKPRGPYIALDSPCPACGHGNWKIRFLREEMKVFKVCQVCTCQTTEPPVAPSLFRDTPQVLPN